MPNDVTMPGGEKCYGGRCEKVSKILRAKVSTKSRYNINKSKPNPNPSQKPEPTIKPKEKMLLSVTNHSAGEPDEKTYDAEDTKDARAETNKKYATSGKYVK